MALFGTEVRRVEDPRLLTTGGEYVADLDLPGCVSVTYVTATDAHAFLRDVDIREARVAPGVLDVVVAGDLTIGPCALVNDAFPATMRRPLLAGERVRYVGEPVVAIVAEDAMAAADAASLVVVDTEPIPAVVGIDAARTARALLFPEAGTNVVWERRGGSDEAEVDAALADSDVVIRATFLNPRVAPCPVETRAGARRAGRTTGASRTGRAARGPIPFGPPSPRSTASKWAKCA